MLPVQLTRNEDELAIIKAIAESSDDGPILMLNLNRYRPGAGFPGVGLHKDYIDGLEKFCASWAAQFSGTTRCTGKP
jgi:hypothetical protein